MRAQWRSRRPSRSVASDGRPREGDALEKYLATVEFVVETDAPEELGARMRTLARVASDAGFELRSGRAELFTDEKEADDDMPGWTKYTPLTPVTVRRHNPTPAQTTAGPLGLEFGIAETDMGGMTRIGVRNLSRRELFWRTFACWCVVFGIILVIRWL